MIWPFSKLTSAAQQKIETGDIKAGGDVKLENQVHHHHYYGLTPEKVEKVLQRNKAHYENRLNYYENQPESQKDHQVIYELRITLAELERDLADTQVAYEREIERCREIEAELERLQQQQPDKQIAQALKELKQGRMHLAEKLLTELHETSLANAAHTAYLLGGIKRDKFELKESIRWHEKAVELEPENAQYQEAAAEAQRPFDEHQALKYLGQALVLLQKQMNGDTLHTASVLEKIGGYHSRKGNYVAAISAYEEALQLRERLQDSDHLEIATTLNNLANPAFSR